MAESAVLTLEPTSQQENSDVIFPPLRLSEQTSLTPRLIDNLTHPRRTDEILDAFDVIGAHFTLADTVRAIDIFAHSEHGMSGQQAHVAVNTLEIVLTRSESESLTQKEINEQKQLVAIAFQSIKAMLPGILASTQERKDFIAVLKPFRWIHPDVAEYSNDIFSKVTQVEEEPLLLEEKPSNNTNELLDEDRKRINDALATLHGSSNVNNQQTQLNRTHALKVITDYHNRALPYLQEQLLDQGRELELAQFIDNLAGENDINFILQTLQVERIGRSEINQIPGEIISKTLITLIHDMRMYPEKGRDIKHAVAVIIAFLEENPKINPTIQYNCRNAISLAETDEAITYLTQLQPTEYLSSDVIYANWGSFLTRCDLFQNIIMNSSNAEWESNKRDELHEKQSFLTSVLNNYTKEQWKKDIARLVRRVAIERSLFRGSLSETKKYVYAFEKGLKVDELIDSLVNSEFTISSRMASVAKEVSEEILEKFPQVKAIVLLGGSIHGGARIRETTQERPQPDFDWGVIFKDNLPSNLDEILNKILEEGNNILEGVKERYGLDDSFHADEYIYGANPKNAYTTEIKSSGEFLSNFLDLEQITLFLQPSFPPEVNEENRKILKEGLTISGF